MTLYNEWNKLALKISVALSKITSDEIYNGKFLKVNAQKLHSN